jgi:hypothetical protein
VNDLLGLLDNESLKLSTFSPLTMKTVPPHHK